MSNMGEDLASHDNSFDVVEKEMIVDAALKVLSPYQYEVVMRKYWGKQSIEEIARDLGKSPLAIRKALSRSVRAMRKKVRGTVKSHLTDHAIVEIYNA